jgi:hypothetical protein
MLFKLKTNIIRCMIVKDLPHMDDTIPLALSPPWNGQDVQILESVPVSEILKTIDLSGE